MISMAYPSGTDAKAERRGLERLALQLVVKIAGKSPYNGAFEEHTYTENISSGGAYFFLDNHVDEGASLELFIYLPYGVQERKVRVKVRGTVLRAEKRVVNAREKHAVAVKFYKFKFLTRDITNQ